MGLVSCCFSLCVGTDLEIHIMFGVENAIAPQIAVCMASILNSTTENEKIHFHFVGELFNRTNSGRILFLKEIFRSFTTEWASFDLSRLQEFDSGKWNKMIMLKIFASEIFPSLNRILWLDYDTLILNNIRDVFEMNMDGKYVAAVDYCPRGRVCVPSWKSKCKHLWINGGFMVFNLGLIRKNGLQGEILRAARRKEVYFGSKEEYSIAVAAGKEGLMVLPCKYNVPSGKDLINCSTKKYRFNISDTVMLHYCHPDFKPWNVKNRLHPLFLDIYMKYCKLLLRERNDR